MYLDFFGLDRKPFENTPDAAFLYPSGIHREVLASLIYGVYEGKGFMLVGGDVGTGKTLLLHALAQKMDPEDIVLHIVTPRISADDVLTYLCDRLNVVKADYSSSVQLYDALRKALEGLRHAGRKTVLIIDEAHQLPADTLEEIRLLSNLETAEHKLLQIILAGQNELFEMLNTDALRQLKQRINMSRALRSLTSEETMEYIQHRLGVAGATEAIFSDDAMLAVYEVSEGLPRLINQICDNALLLAFAQQLATVTPALIQEAQEDRAMQTESRAPVANKPRRVSVSWKTRLERLSQWSPGYSFRGVMVSTLVLCILIVFGFAGIGMLQEVADEARFAQAQKTEDAPFGLREIAEKRKAEREAALKMQAMRVRQEAKTEIMASQVQPAIQPAEQAERTPDKQQVVVTPKPRESELAKQKVEQKLAADTTPVTDISELQTVTASRPGEKDREPVVMTASVSQKKTEQELPVTEEVAKTVQPVAKPVKEVKSQTEPEVVKVAASAALSEQSMETAVVEKTAVQDSSSANVEVETVKKKNEKILEVKVAGNVSGESIPIDASDGPPPQPHIKPDIKILAGIMPAATRVASTVPTSPVPLLQSAQPYRPAKPVSESVRVIRPVQGKVPAPVETEPVRQSNQPEGVNKTEEQRQAEQSGSQLQQFVQRKKAGASRQQLDVAGRKIVTADFLPLPSERSRASREALTVKVSSSMALPRLMVQFYGTSGDTLHDLVAAANPQRVKGRRLLAGTVPVYLPQLAVQERVIRSPRKGYYTFYRSFRHLSTANAYLQTFANQKIPSRILVREGSGGKFYRLFLGPFSQFAQAEQVLKQQVIKDYIPRR